MFAYPVGPHKDVRLLCRRSNLHEYSIRLDEQLLFLDRELAETLDPRDDRTSSIRSRLLNILHERMRGNEQSLSQQPSSTTLPSAASIEDASQQNGSGSGPHLPPLNFGPSARRERQPLTPITELSVASHGRGQSGDTQSAFSPSQPSPFVASPQEGTSSLGGPVTKSPTPSLQRVPPPPEKDLISATTSGSHDSSNIAGTSRFEFGSATPSTSLPRASNDSLTLSPNPANVQLPISFPVSPVSPASEKTPTTIFSASQKTPEPSRPPVSPQASVTTSPYSALDSPRTDLGSFAGSMSSAYDGIRRDPGSMSSSVHSRAVPSSNTVTQPQVQIPPPAAARATSADESHNISNEAGALYFMQQFEPQSSSNQSGRMPPTISEEPASRPDSKPDAASSSKLYTIPSNSESGKNPERSPPLRQGTPMSFERIPPESSSSAAGPTERLSPTLTPGLGRKPSGARAPVLARPYNGDSVPPSSQQLAEEDSGNDSMGDVRDRISPTPMQTEASSPNEDSNLDALAALSYLDVKDDTSPLAQVAVEPPKPQTADRVPSPPPAPPGSDAASQYKSSFAPSKQATERKAKAQAQQAAHHAAVHKPGRANGKRKSKAVDRGAWNESSEEDDDDEEDDDADSDAEPATVNTQAAPSSGPVSSNGSSIRPSQNQGQGPSPSDPAADVQAPQTHSHLRPPRTLPQIPGGRPHREH